MKFWMRVSDALATVRRLISCWRRVESMVMCWTAVRAEHRSLTGVMPKSSECCRSHCYKDARSVNPVLCVVEVTSRHVMCGVPMPAWAGFLCSLCVAWFSQGAITVVAPIVYNPCDCWGGPNFIYPSPVDQNFMSLPLVTGHKGYEQGFSSSVCCWFKQGLVNINLLH